MNNLVSLINTNDFFIEKKYMDLGNYYRVKKDYKSALVYYDKIEKITLIRTGHFIIIKVFAMRD